MIRAAILLVGICFGVVAHAATYTIPTGPLPPGCSLSGGDVLCSSGLSLGNNDTINVSQPTSLRIEGDFDYRNNLSINLGGTASDLNITVTGDVEPGNGAVVNASITVSGSFGRGNNGVFTGSLNVAGDLELGNNSQINGDISVGGELDARNNTQINGNIQSHDANLRQNVQVNGNINATGRVENNGHVTGYANVSTLINNGTIDGLTCDINNNVGPCVGGGGGLHHFRLDLNPTVLTCEPTTITVTACGDTGCSNTISPDGSVTLTANGPASYSGSAAFSGDQALLSLAITEPGVYSIDVTDADVQPTDPTQCTGSPGCEVQAVETGFQFSAVATRTAGAAFQQTVTVVRTDDQTGACQTVVSDLDQIELSLDCIDPGQCIDDGERFAAQNLSLSEWPAHTAVPVSFDNTPSADLTMNYEDVGRVRLHARAVLPGGAELAGSSASFVVRPATITTDVSNDVAYGSGIFARAGDPLTVLLMVRSATGATTPNFGNENAAESLTLAMTATTVVPSGGLDGTLSIEEPFIRVTDGVFGSVDVRYQEAGTAAFRALITSGDYLGTGPLEVSSGPYGRFLPWSIAVDLSSGAPACEAGTPPFTYLGQPKETTVHLSALSRSGMPTLNYPDQGNGTGLSAIAYDLELDVSLSDRVDPEVIPVTWEEGLGTVQSAQITIDRLQDGTPDGPFPLVQLALFPDPTDGDGAHIVMDDPDFGDSGDDCSGGDCFAVMADDPGEWVYGRLVLPDVYGPEIEPVALLFEAQAYDGERFLRHRADQCTDYSADGVTITSNQSGLTSVASGPGGTLDSGRSADDNLVMTAPGEPGVLHIEYDAPVWLRSVDGANPETSVSFGRYRGHDLIIFKREVH